jgi:hypothetical protein
MGPCSFRVPLTFTLGVLLAHGAFGGGREKAFVPDLSRLNDGKLWRVINADHDAATEDGNRVVRLRPKGGAKPGSNIGLALLEGVEFAEGTLEIDLKGRGQREASFVGVAFSAVDGKTFEAVYFRPFNFRKDDKVFRDRAVQYVAWPEHTWEKLRKEKPGTYEAAVHPVPDPSAWFHARMEVTKHKVSVWVDDAKAPCLVVERLTGREKGRVGLWVDSQEGTFRGLRILAAK